MNIESCELDKEKAHAEDTLDIIREVIDEKNINIEEYKSEIVERKKFIWNNKHEFNSPELYNTMDEENLSVRLINNDIKKVYQLYRSLENPYFSRIDFKSNEGEDTFYIGLTGVDRDYEPVVYDWRASISNLYYNYGLGKAKYPSSDGEISGEVTLKRGFEFNMGKLINVCDFSSNVNDSLLDEVLKNNTSDVMKNIVSTIQSEQNDIIRYPSVPLIVEGSAGSGKTSVALHRIAYLLYNQKNLSYKNVLIFSPSEVFSHYISNVLPELGEENVSTTTFDDFATSYIRGIGIEPLTEFIERCYEKSDIDSKKIEHKLSLDYKADCDKFLDAYYDSLKFTQKIGLKKTMLSASELNALKDKVSKKLSFHDRLEYLAEKICEAFDLDESKNAEKFYKIISKMFEIERDPLRLYSEFTKETFEDEVPYEDITAILYLYFEIHGYPKTSEVKFVIIDEAQDYSKWQFELIHKIFNSAKVTVFGDPNQRINPYLRYNSLKEIEYIFNGSKYMRLGFSYRSSREVMMYANNILALNNDNIVRGNIGIEVQEIEESVLKDDISKCITNFREHGLKKLAVITKNSEEAHFIESLELDVEVVPVYLSKGLEYDGVIVWTRKNNRYTLEEKHLFYVAVTRALHGLVVMNQKK